MTTIELPPLQLVAVELRLYNKDTSTAETLRICNLGPLISTIDDAQFRQNLLGSITVEQSINFRSYGAPARIANAVGDIRVALDGVVGSYLDTKYSWLGREILIYTGLYGDTLEDMALVFVGRVSSVTHDGFIIGISVVDRSIDFDLPLQTIMYSAGPSSNYGKPEPLVFGSILNAEPILSDAANSVYDINRNGNALAAVTSLRVGGIVWTQVAGTPTGAQYSVDLPNGQVKLGSSTAGGEVRVDATLDADFLLDVERVVAQAGGSNSDIDIATITAMRDVGVASFGYYARDPVNVLDLFDEVFAGLGCWWGFTSDGLLTAGEFFEPALTASMTLDDVNISSLALTETLPPVILTKVFYKKNWQPSGQFFSAVPDLDKAIFQSANQAASVSSSGVIKTDEPRAIDDVTIDSTIVDSAAAANISSRLSSIWSVTRRIFEVEVRGIEQAAISLFDTVAVNYRQVSANFRVMGITRSYGGGPCMLQLWG